MEVKINMLNVKDGDAIIVELIKPDDTLVIVIDGGEKGYYESKVKPKLIEVLNKHQKKAPDLVVCTHYDSDHIGGLIPLLTEYIDDVKEVWVHNTSASLSSLLLEMSELKNSKLTILKSFKEVSLEKELINNSGAEKLLVQAKTDFFIESLSQLKELIDIIPAAKLKQVFHKQSPLKNWPEIKVLGPTKEYFQKLFPKGKKLKEMILEELEVTKGEFDLIEEMEKALVNPCDKLKNDGTAKITSTNKASIIIAIDNENGRYLFTGDAGIESFKNVPEWQNELKDIYFLKVPHHGSNNNMSKEIAEKMKPLFAFNSGDTFQDNEVIECLAQKTLEKKVSTTKANGDLFFDK